MSKHSQPRRKSRGTGLWPVAFGLGALVTGVAWVYLVSAAIDFGVLALAGVGVAWAFTLAASLGAVFCLLLFLSLGARALKALGMLSDEPRSAGGGRRKH